MYINDAKTGLLTSAFDGVQAYMTGYCTSDMNSFETTRQTVETMCRLIRASMRYGAVQAVAAKVWGDTTAPLSQKSETELVVRWWKWVTANVVLVEDEKLIVQGEISKELLISPEVLLTMKQPQGDCDDFSMLTAAVFRLWGYAVRLVTGAAIETSPNVFSHVWVRVKSEVDGEWIDLDCSHGPWLGWSVVQAANGRGKEIMVAEWEVG